jgi:H+/gluconate symporter-like permease
MVRRSLGPEATGEVTARGLSTTGQILLITGVGGSLGTVIGDTDLGDVLQGLFTAGAGASIAVTILVAWFIAVVLHVAIGSITVAAILAAGIMTPVLSSIDVSPAIIGLAVGAGSLFALHVNSNFFWMFQSLLGISTRGALKSLTFVSAISSVVALPMIVVLGYLVG